MKTKNLKLTTEILNQKEMQGIKGGTAHRKRTRAIIDGKKVITKTIYQ